MKNLLFILTILLLCEFGRANQCANDLTGKFLGQSNLYDHKMTIIDRPEGFDCDELTIRFVYIKGDQDQGKIFAVKANGEMNSDIEEGGQEFGRFVRAYFNNGVLVLEKFATENLGQPDKEKTSHVYTVLYYRQGEHLVSVLSYLKGDELAAALSNEQMSVGDIIREQKAGEVKFETLVDELSPEIQTVLEKSNQKAWYSGWFGFF